MEISARIVTLTLAETFTIARESTDTADVVHVAIRHDGIEGRGEAAPIERYGENAGSALAFVEEHGDLVGDDPFALEEIGGRLVGDPGRAGGEVRDRRRAARPPGKAARRAGLAAARAPSHRAADLVDGLARRPGRHGPPGRARRRALRASEAEARRRRRPGRRSRAGRARCHRPAVDGRRQRVLVARRGARGDPAARRARRGVRGAAAACRRPRWRDSARAVAASRLRRRGLPRC